MGVQRRCVGGRGGLVLLTMGERRFWVDAALEPAPRPTRLVGGTPEPPHVRKYIRAPSPHLPPARTSPILITHARTHDKATRAPNDAKKKAEKRQRARAHKHSSLPFLSPPTPNKSPLALLLSPPPRPGNPPVARRPRIPARADSRTHSPKERAKKRAPPSLPPPLAPRDAIPSPLPPQIPPRPRAHRRRTLKASLLDSPRKSPG